MVMVIVSNFWRLLCAGQCVDVDGSEELVIPILRIDQLLFMECLKDGWSKFLRNAGMYFLNRSSRYIYVRKTNKMQLNLNIFQLNYLLYFIPTNKFLIRKLFLYTQHTVFLMHLWVSSR
jgi:hypothetical protein